MHDVREVPAIVLARSLSKRLKDKNIALLGGRPLLRWVIKAAHDSGVIDEIYVSTDSARYGVIARMAGCQVINRPPELATDDATSESGIAHALRGLNQNYGLHPNVACLLQPTSPFTRPETIRKAVAAVSEAGYDTAMSVTEVKSKPWWAWTRNDDGRLKPFLLLASDSPYAGERPPPLYAPTGGCYAFRTSFFQTTSRIYGGNCYGVVVDEREAIDIDTPLDIQFARFLVENAKG